MGMIRYKGSSVASGLGFWQELRQPFKEVFPIGIIPENLSALYPSDCYMMQEAGGIYSGYPGQAGTLPRMPFHVN
jgi:hypothetical protein